jgi:uncharacterized surface protein with fasciclin (FAS1) repeats
MNSKNRPAWINKLTGTVIAMGISLPIGLPVLAQSYYSASIFSPSSTSTSRSVDGTIAGELDAAIKYYLDFQTFAEAVQEAGLAESLRAKDSNDPDKILFTVFVPTDEAFEALPEDIRQKLFQPENRDKLMMVLNYHLVEGMVSDEDVATGAIETVAGSPVKIELDVAGDKIALNEAATILSSQRAKNGVLVSIDRVLLPPDLELE